MLSMNRPSNTICYYDDHADEYVSSTICVDMTSLYRPFLEWIPAGGKILDVGCGSGRDTKAFLDLGYEVTAIDASRKMVEATTRLTGKPARHLLLQEIKFQNVFDGVWACASLLHIPRIELDSALNCLMRALCANGVCYLSFKEGEDESTHSERHFTNFTVTTLKVWLACRSDVEIVRIWTTDDARPGNTEQWVNGLIKKKWA